MSSLLSTTLAQHRRPLVVSLAVLLLLRSRLLEIPKEALSKALTQRGLTSKLSSEQLTQALQQLYIREPDGSKTLLVPSQNGGISKVSSIATVPRIEYYGSHSL
jgi:ATP-binding cassette, subfamily D (ALD), peroxisomal long-chain fatty acid import protein